MALTLTLLLATAFASTYAVPQMLSANLGNANGQRPIYTSHERPNTFLAASAQSAANFMGHLTGPVAGNPRCHRNERFDKCGSGCTVTCSNYRRSSDCDRDCRPGCFCVDGFVRDDRDRWNCVPAGDCDQHHHHHQHHQRRHRKKDGKDNDEKSGKRGRKD